MAPDHAEPATGPAGTGERLRVRCPVCGAAVLAADLPRPNDPPDRPARTVIGFHDDPRRPVPGRAGDPGCLGAGVVRTATVRRAWRRSAADL